MPSKHQKWLKFHEEQYEFKVLFILCTNLESFLKPVDEQPRENMDKTKTDKKMRDRIEKK